MLLITLHLELKHMEFKTYRIDKEHMVEDKNQNVELTDHEAELYDRQIRLWGLESQKRQVQPNLT
ncbi:hypothetical protein WN51_13850 [Melipona quadrifasciata]|uniref:Uncharacterized protein n=1 Tax=Melipona quadrifasciata TaxID=166423 RepID=A0A0N0BFY6_9HYME|nr:hypothetical protein WN51_13850 [Melipona quadrifasciata]